MDLLDNARIKQLLEQAESAVRMLSRVDSHGKRQVKHALTGIYEDLGRHVHGLARKLEARSGDSAANGDAPISLDELEDLTNEIENTDEVSGGDTKTKQNFATGMWFNQQVDESPVPVDQVEATIQQSLGEIRKSVSANNSETNWVLSLIHI